MKPLLKKFGKTNYNDILEKVLEKKDFTATTKSLLLSMLYKVEIAYNDYKMVKVLVKIKEKFLEDIIETIDKKCVIIKLVEPNSEIGLKMQKKNQEAFIENAVALVCFPTENSLLYGITLLMDNNFHVKPTFRTIEFAIKDFFRISYSDNIRECILNFDGWSWNNQSFDEKECLYCLVYYNFLNLCDLNLIEEWRSSENSQDYVEKFAKILIQKYGEDNSKRMLILLYRFFLKIMVTTYNNEVFEILEEGKNIKNAINYMSNKSLYMQDIYDKKKKINERIKEIEQMMLDKNILRQKYEEINSALPLNKQIFSVRRFLIIIKQERETLYNEIKNYNMKLDPKRYIKEKEILEDSYIKFTDIEKMQKSKTSLKLEILRIQKKFLELKELELEKVETKKEILAKIYILRYYKNMELGNKDCIKTEKLLKKSLWNYERKLLSKACQNHIFIKLSDNNLQNIELLSKILDTKIIDLRDLGVLPRVDKNKIVLDIYDSEILDTSLVLGEKVKELNLRPNKKVKVLL